MTGLVCSDCGHADSLHVSRVGRCITGCGCSTFDPPPTPLDQEAS